MVKTQMLAFTYAEDQLMKRIVGWAMLLVMLMVCSGCGYLIVGGAGAAGGYVLRDKGYKVQSPVEKDGQNES